MTRLYRICVLVLISLGLAWLGTVGDSVTGSDNEWTVSQETPPPCPDLDDDEDRRFIEELLTSLEGSEYSIVNFEDVDDGDNENEGGKAISDFLESARSPVIQPEGSWHYKMPISGQYVYWDDSPFTEVEKSTNGQEITELTSSANDAHSFRGRIVDSMVANDDSLVALHIQPDRDLNGNNQIDDDERNGFISGFYINSISNPQKGYWEFMEPLRPLLKPLIHPNSMFAPYDWGSLQILDDQKHWTEYELDQHVPMRCRTHIVYPVFTQEPNGEKKANLNFHIDLDPRFHRFLQLFEMRFMLLESGYLPNPAPSATFPQGRTPNNYPGIEDGHVNEIPIVAVADPSYRDLFDRVITEKTWYEAQEEVINLVDAFYRSTFADTFKFAIRGLESWDYGSSDIGPQGAAVPIDAFSKLCQFAQDTPNAVGVSSHQMPDFIAGDDLAFIAHLFTANDLGPLPEGIALLDTGEGFCPGSGCGSNGQDIIGMAEGIGGFRNIHPNLWHLLIRVCKTKSAQQLTGLLYPNELGIEPEDYLVQPLPFEPSSYHSISQQGPDIARKPTPVHPGPELYLSLADLANDSDLRTYIYDLGHSFTIAEDVVNIQIRSEKLNNHYNALLYQRFLLLAHEIGHNLGGIHPLIYDENCTTPQLENENLKTVMSPRLSGNIQFRMDEVSIQQIMCHIAPITDECPELPEPQLCQDPS